MLVYSYPSQPCVRIHHTLTCHRYASFGRPARMTGKVKDRGIATVSSICVV